MKDGPNGQGDRFYSVNRRSSFSHTVVLFFILSVLFIMKLVYLNIKVRESTEVSFTFSIKG